MRKTNKLYSLKRAATSCIALATLAAGAPVSAAESAKLLQANDPYFLSSKAHLQKVLAQRPNTRRAKNIILFIGDGYGVTTMTAARIFAGQQKGVDGPSYKLAHENFPYSAFSRTYAHDSYVTDSAPSAVSMTTGVKTNQNVMAVSSKSVWKDCEKSKGSDVTTIAEIAKSLGMAAGAVSTARVTDATPGSLYIHSAHRSWESDADLTEEAVKNGCADGARQLIEFKYGDGIDVMMGGGRMSFIPATMDDPEYAPKKGTRKDGRDLTQEWLKRYPKTGAYAWNLAGFNAIDPKSVNHALALFEPNNMQYDYDRPKDKGGEPSLAQMTEKAIDIMQKNPKGFFLMVEGGRIDHGSHANNAYRTLTDAVAMDEALKVALAKTSLKDTLIIVTADHSHTMSMAGYSDRDAPILGVSTYRGKPLLDLNGKPYTTIGFANGPGAKEGPRKDLTSAQTTDPDYIQESKVPLSSETHGGEDVAIMAAGPWAHLFQGVVDQNYIFQVMDHAMQGTARLKK